MTESDNNIHAVTDDDLPRASRRRESSRGRDMWFRVCGYDSAVETVYVFVFLQFTRYPVVDKH